MHITPWPDQEHSFPAPYRSQLPAQSTVCFGNQITTYTAIHTYLQSITASASRATQGWDSPPTKGTNCTGLTGFLLSAYEPWSLFLSRSNSLMMCKGKSTNSFLCLPSYLELCGKGSLNHTTGIKQSSISKQRWCFCSSFLVALKRVFLPTTKRQSAQTLAAHTNPPIRLQTGQTALQILFTGILKKSTGKTRGSLISPGHQDNAHPQGCSP